MPKLAASIESVFGSGTARAWIAKSLPPVVAPVEATAVVRTVHAALPTGPATNTPLLIEPTTNVAVDVSVAAPVDMK